MNIICNNCVGARLYEVTKQQFPNQFMWMTISPDDFIKLINDYDTIDFQHPNIGLEKYQNHPYDSILITLSNGVKLHYIHYIKDDSKHQPVKEMNTNILFYNILNYAKQKWFNRLARNTESPTFLFSFNYMKPGFVYNKILNNLLQIKDKHLLILIHENVEINTEIPQNIKIIKCPNDIMELNSTMLAKRIKNIIFSKDNEYNL